MPYKSYENFPAPPYSERPPEEIIIKNIDTLRRAIRGELEQALTLKDPTCGIAQALLEQQQLTKQETTQLLHLPPSQKIRPALATTNRHLSPLKLVFRSTLPDTKPNLYTTRFQIESDKIELTDHLPQAIRKAHSSAEESVGTDNLDTTPFTAKHIAILQPLINQYWGLSPQLIYMSPEDIISEIPTINKIAEDNNLLFRITIRNDIMILTSKDKKVQIPCLDKNRERKPKKPPTRNIPARPIEDRLPIEFAKFASDLLLKKPAEQPPTNLELLERIEELQAIIAAQGKEIAALKALQAPPKPKTFNPETIPTEIKSIEALTTIISEATEHFTGITFLGRKVRIPENPVSTKQVRDLGQYVNKLRNVKHGDQKIQSWLIAHIRKLGGIVERHSGKTNLSPQILHQVVNFPF